MASELGGTGACERADVGEVVLPPPGGSLGPTDASAGLGISVPIAPFRKGYLPVSPETPDRYVRPRGEEAVTPRTPDRYVPPRGEEAVTPTRDSKPGDPGPTFTTEAPASRVVLPADFERVHEPVGELTDVPLTVDELSVDRRVLDKQFDVFVRDELSDLAPTVDVAVHEVLTRIPEIKERDAVELSLSQFEELRRSPAGLDPCPVLAMDVVRLRVEYARVDQEPQPTEALKGLRFAISLVTRAVLVWYGVPDPIAKRLGRAVSEVLAGQLSAEESVRDRWIALAEHMLKQLI